jgi:protein-S-isoprenylcysteine O-methyltransferase Ste14
MKLSQSGEEIRAFLENVGLGILLVGFYFYSFGLAAFAALADWDARLMLVLTVTLVTNVLRRPRPVAIDRRWWVCLVAAISTCYIAAFNLNSTQTYEPNAFVVIALWITLVIRIAAEFCLIWLGTSFAILPALREVRVGFLYRYVRHPVYSIYMLLDLVFVALAPSLRNFAVAAVGASTFLIRAKLEERVLSTDPAYQNYRRKTRWRFLPGAY